MTSIDDVRRGIARDILGALAQADAAGFALAGIHLNAALTALGHSGVAPPDDSPWRERQITMPLLEPPGTPTAESIREGQRNEPA